MLISTNTEPSAEFGPDPAVPRHRSYSLRQRVLALIYPGGGASRLESELRRLESSEGALDVFVVAPATNSRLRFWCNDDAEAIASADDRLREVLSCLHVGGDLRGRVGDPDPLLAVGDALTEFRADRLIVATEDQARPQWLERNLIDQTSPRCLPVTHLAALPSSPTAASEATKASLSDHR